MVVALRTLYSLLPVGVAALVVLVIVIAIHLLTLSQQASASTLSGVASYTAEGVPVTSPTSASDEIQQNILASGALCPIHSLGFFGTGTSHSLE